MLYRPTNLIPSNYVGDGMGIIDGTVPNVFSADINGYSPAVAYQCGIFKNNAQSDLVYDTGIIQFSEPLYGADISGDVTPFTFTIPKSLDGFDYFTQRVVYDSTLFTYTVSFDDFTYTAGMMIGFVVPTSITTETSIIIKVGELEFTMSDIPNWAAGQNVFVVLSNIEDVYTATETFPEYTLIKNGYSYGYKYILTLWWDYNPASFRENCVQSFETVFYAKAMPTVSINQFWDSVSEGTPVIHRPTCTWTAQYSQSNNAGITWFQWTLALANDHTIIIDQTKKVYSNAKIEYLYDGLIQGVSYAIECSLQTQDGVFIESGWSNFDVLYDVVNIESAIGISQTSDNGIKLDWSQIQYIMGIANNLNYRYLKPLPQNGHICVELMEGNQIDFTSSTHFDLEIPIDAQFVWSGYLDGDNDSVYYAYGTDNNGDSYYLRLSHAGTVDGLYPSTSLYPSGTLYPNAGSGGRFILDVNGMQEYTFNTEFVRMHWYIIRMNSLGIYVSEIPFTLDMSNITIVNP